MKKTAIIIFTVLLALLVFVSCEQSVGDLIGFDLVFNANGGTGSMEKTFIKGSSASAPENRFTRNGYTFVSWNTMADGSGKEYKVGDNINGHDVMSVTLFAQWKANTYEIEVAEAEHGRSFSLYDSYTVRAQETTIPLSAIADEGYRLASYAVSVSAQGQRAYVDETNTYLIIPAGTYGKITVTPTFAANDYFVRFNANGGYGMMNDEAFAFDVSQKLTKNTFAKEGFTFVKWNTNEGGSGLSFDNEEVVTNLASSKGEIVTLFAQWEANKYDIKVIPSAHGSVLMSSTKYSLSNSIQTIGMDIIPDTGYELNTLTASSPAAISEASLTIPAGTIGEITVTPTFKPCVWSVDFDIDGGTINSGNISQYTYGIGAVLPSSVSKDGATFAGWYDNPNFTGSAVEAISATDKGDKTFYALWNTTKYTIGINNPETGGTAALLYNKYTINDGATVIPLVDSPAKGYRLWDYVVNGEGASIVDNKYLKIEAGTTGAISVTPHFIPVVYTITINRSDRGRATSDASGYTISDEKQYVNLTVIPDPGCEVYDWAVSAPTGVTVSNGVITIPAGTIGDISVSPIFLPRFNVTLVGNGGTIDEGYDVTHYFFGDGAILPTASHITKTGYTFGGWFTNPECTTGQTTVISDTDMGAKTFYAKWTVNTYTVQFAKNSADATGSMSNQGFEYGVTEALTANAFTWLGHTFDGWNTKADGTGTSYAGGYSESKITDVNGAVVTLYAQWHTNTYKVYFNKNASSATGTMADESFTYGESKALTTNAFTRTGYTFSGWNITSGGTGTSYADGASVQNLSSVDGGIVSLYAQWSPISYSVKFDKNSAAATGTMADESFTYDVAKSLTTVGFSRIGYTFSGWNTKADGTGTSYADKQSVSNLSSTSGAVVNLYAQWAVNSYGVTLNAKGGTIASGHDVTSYTYGVGATLPTSDYIAKTGYTFGGWYDNEACTGTAVTAISTTATGAKTFYAKWTANTYSVKFDKNAAAATGSMSDESFTYDAAKGLTPNSFVNIGYTFTGWNTKADGTGTSYANGQNVSNLTSAAGGTVTLYAQWELTQWNITFTSGTEHYSISQDVAKYTYSGNDLVITLTVVPEAGYPQKSVDHYAATIPGTATLIPDWANGKATVKSGSYGGDIVVTCYF